MSAAVPSPELLLPAGSFDSAVAAIDGGADALYFGFADFSARKQAKNFGELEYRRLHRLARERGVRLYATLNTVVMESELPAASRLLAFLGRFPPDAILVQDWGLGRLIRERQPGIAIHASTQTAIQGVEAARIARELGAVRIVLPRETSLAEMRAIKEAEPGLELEVFVHGALCYSFSGLCLASGLVLGRSGNRGECAQLCRSYYDADRPLGSEGDRRGYWFSCRDLELGGRVGELARAGVSSLKIEGRMKSPEYCHAVARLYRGYIDALAGAGPGAEELAEREEAARVAFSRSPTEAWLFERGGSRLIDSAYPGHRGILAGRIEKVRGRNIQVELKTPIALRDGLLAFEPAPAGGPPRPLRFSALGLVDARTGRELARARAGSLVGLELPLVDEEEGRGGRIPRVVAGEELRLISSRARDRKVVSPEEYEAEREELPLELRFGLSGLAASFTLPSFSAAASSDQAELPPSGPLPLDAAKSPGGFERALALFAESGEADFRLVPRYDPESPVELPDGRKLRLAELFVPPSALKKEKNRIYAEVAARIAQAQADYASASMDAVGSIEARAAAPAGDFAAPPRGAFAPPRRALVFPRPELPSGMPFATRRDLADKVSPPEWDSRSWLPLAPLVADLSEYRELALERACELLDSGARLAVGIGALHHVEIGRELATLCAGAGDRLSFFLDFSLYAANGLAFASFRELLPRLEFAYRYLELEDEGGELAKSPLGSRLVPVGPGFEPPLFQSFGCLLKHHVNGGSCPSDCDRSWNVVLSDRDRRYTALVEDCVSYLFRSH